jgi:hypothetical protein
MRHLLLAAVATLSAGSAGAVTYTSVAGAPDQGPVAPLSVVIDFESAVLPTGYSLSGSWGRVNTTVSGQYASPAPNNSTDYYFYTSSRLATNNATLSTPNLSAVGFYWGSIDTYNRVDVLGAGGATLFTLSGSTLINQNFGNQSLPSTNRRVTFFAEGDEVITGLKFTSTGVAFEIDDIAVAGVVPEPATWAMLIAGFGLVGAAMRRQRLAPVRVSA